MFKKCKYCNSAYKGEGYFCSDTCEIKSHTSEIMMFKNNTPIFETKEELIGTPVPETKIIEKNLEMKNKVLKTPALS